ncbi:MAG: hypothetical protein CFE34_13545 [Rhodobacteraceae bacterium PARR1]|jgi:hypothetical protein|nr:MAG: hypothetical protein A3D16_20375 [Rhodobacterales bacterium RIFCSPHIGHO2_02_FULL_62_130]OHC56919.1 MAG: hypothetical protein A3E48_17815 [Rhodobacterales bacterium RIFCSPHIGHO2_12_FULL_62_75]OYU17858.1 MAG: hypothetical protein CFE34_13545 [Rhodobacteraceae bacterium PARR1]
MPNRKYGVFNIKMTNTIKEGCMIYPELAPAGVPCGQLHRSALEKMEPSCETQTLRKAQEILAYLRIPAANSSARLALPMRRREVHLASIIVVMFVNSAAFAQPKVIRCLPPEVPVTDLPEAVLAEYRSEISAEFEAYFAAVSTHITCLDTERSRALSEARVATEAYSAFLNIPPAQKDLP